ncbi:MAG: hypothetical protein ABSG94_09605 [Brevinematales bacterium]|jgi:hypothetical protein
MKRLQFFACTAALMIVSFVYLGCDVQAFQPATHLAAPLDLQVISNDTANGFWLQFEGFNTETYFSGYFVQISLDGTNFTNLYNPAVLTTPADTNLTTIQALMVTGETSYYLNVVQIMIPPYQTSLITLHQGTTYYFQAEAYSSEYTNTSRPSEVLSVIYNGP